MPDNAGGIEATAALDDFGLDPKLARLSSSIRQLEAEMLLLQRRMQQGTGDSKAMTDALDTLSSAHVRHTDRAATMATATHRDHRGPEGLADSSARNLMDVGRHVDDLQSKTITAAEGMKKLGNATSRTVEEAVPLNRLKREPQYAEGHRSDLSGEEPPIEKAGALVDRVAGGNPGHRNDGPLATLQDRLAHLTQVEQGGGGSLTGPDYEPSTKSVASDDAQFRKLQDIGKTLEEIRKLHAESKTIGVKRRR